MVSERATQVRIARARAGLDLPRCDGATVRSVLADVMDPELPVVSITDMGMVGAIAVDETAIRVEIHPTFVGCPATELIRAAVAERLVGFGRSVEVISSYAPPWSSERITPAGLAALATAGIAPPAPADEVRCPLCGSGRVAVDNVFGPTPCRSLFYCRDCRQPFEAIKPI